MMRPQHFMFFTLLIFLAVVSAVPSTGVAQSQFEFEVVMLSGDSPSGQVGTAAMINSDSGSFLNERLSDAGVFEVVLV